MKNLFYGCLPVMLMCSLSSCSKEYSKDDLVGTWEINATEATYMVWESSEPINANGTSIPTTEVAEVTSQFANIFLPEKLLELEFTNDDKLAISYYDEDTHSRKKEVYGTYRVVGRSELSFSPDVDKLLEGVDGIDNTTLAEIKLMARTGLPIKYYFTGGSTNYVQFFLNTKTMKAMKSLFPIIGAAITGNSDDDAMIRSVLENLPAHMDKTGKIELGMNFNKKNNR